MMLKTAIRFVSFSLCACLALPGSSHAIVNVEQAVIGRPAEGVHTTLDLLASGASGNTDKTAYRSELLSLWQHGAHTEYLQLQTAYGKSNGNVDTDKGFAHLRHRTDMSQAWSVEGFVQTGRDRFARMSQRNLAGGGLRRVLFEEQGKSAGYLGMGAFYEHETLSAVAGTTDPEHQRLWRANLYLIYKRQLNENVRLYSTTYYQPAIARAYDFRALEQASLLVKLRENLDLKISLDFTFDSRPPQTVEKRDMTYSTGLAFSF